MGLRQERRLIALVTGWNVQPMGVMLIDEVAQALKITPK